MSAQQSSYALELTNAIEGMLFDSRDSMVVALRNDVGAEVPYGHLVCQSTSDSDAFVLAVNAGVVAGVLIHAHNHEHVTTGLPDDKFGNILQRGIVWVITEDACTVDDTPRVRVADGGGYTKGSIRVGSSAGNTAPLSGCKFMRAAGAGELVPLYINLSSPIVLNDD